MTIVVSIFALSFPPSIMFQREFARKMDADDYQAMFQKIGHCHIRRTTK